MKILLVIALVLLTVGAQSAFASTDLPSDKDPQSAYKSGYNHGFNRT